MSIPYALSSEHIYKVRIEGIDGKKATTAVRYKLAPGEHTVTVSPLLDVEWSPDLLENPESRLRTRDLKLNMESGKTYQLAVKVDVEASVESQLDQSYWSPFVFTILED